MRIVVTGANGLLGRRVIRGLVSSGQSVVGLSRGPRRVEGDFEYVSSDLTQLDSLQKLLIDLRPDSIIHTAALTDVDKCEHEVDGAFVVNVAASHTIAAAARNSGAHLVYVSTDYVFDGEHGPYSEESVPNPLGRYAQSKLGGELAVRIAAGDWAIARTAVVYGWPPAGRKNFGSWIVESLSRGQGVKLFRDQMVSPSLALNAAGMVAELATRRLTGVWHTCGADVVSRVTFGQTLCRIFGLDRGLITAVSLDHVPLSGPRPRVGGLRTDKARRELNVKPMPLEESLRGFKAEYDASR